MNRQRRDFFFTVLCERSCGLFKQKQLIFALCTGNQLISSKCLPVSPLPLGTKKRKRLLLYAREVCVLYLT